jgi:hypothetical protein
MSGLMIPLHREFAYITPVTGTIRRMMGAANSLPRYTTFLFLLVPYKSERRGTLTVHSIEPPSGSYRA